MGFLIGSLVGFGVGMLTAPSTGAEIRGRLRERARPAVSRVREMRERFRRQAEQARERMEAA